MKLLAAECSAGPASCAIMENGKIIASDFTNVKVTHSQTLMPMIVAMLEGAGLTFDDIDAFAVSAGPGSFTGIRIGIALLKGLALPKNKPIAAVSTLAAMAEPFRDTDCLLCCAMDARCNQVYNALFRISGGEITRLCPDRALMCEELAVELKENYKNEKIIVTGDGAAVLYPHVQSFAEMAKEPRLYQSAEGVALAARDEDFTEPSKIEPVYLRLPQAERELKAKQKEK